MRIWIILDVFLLLWIFFSLISVGINSLIFQTSGTLLIYTTYTVNHILFFISNFVLFIVLSYIANRRYEIGALVIVEMLLVYYFLVI